MTTGTFTYEWANPKTDGSLPSATKVYGAPRSGHPQITALETEIFVPSLITQGRDVVVEGLDSNDSYRHDESRQTLFIVARDVNPDKIHRVIVSVSPPLTPGFELNHFWGDFGGRVAFLVFTLVIGVVATFSLA
jgi:hypothetical protein